MSKRFDGVLYGIAENIRKPLSMLPQNIKQNIEEIRLRKNLPLAVTVLGETVFINVNGQTSFTVGSNTVYVNSVDLQESFRLLSNNSAFAHSEELKKGYLKLKDGSRVGISGEIGKDSVKEINSLNIRIARQINGCALKLAAEYRGENWLIAGPPGCGKTTVLRDFIRLISSGFNGKIYRTAVIDNRGEIWGSGENDLGLATDVLSAQSKAKGIEIALRTLFPEVIAFDEIGTSEEAEQISNSFNAGVSVITTAHIGTVEELTKRNITRQLLSNGYIQKVAVLPRLHGGKIIIRDSESFKNQYA